MSASSKQINVVIADDHPLFMQGVESLLSTANHMTLKRKLPDGDSLLECVADMKTRIDVVVLDLSMPGLKTEDLIDALFMCHQDIKLIALTMHADPHLAHRLLNRGLSAYVLKDSAFDDLQYAIEAVVKGNTFVSEALVDEVKRIEIDSESEYLTRQEERVLMEISRGLSNKVVAKQLDISERTVRFHLENCCEKLGANGRADAVNIARARKLINS